MIMLLDTSFDPQTFFWDPFPLKGPPYLLYYFKFNCGNLKIRRQREMEIRRLPEQNQVAPCTVKQTYLTLIRLAVKVDDQHEEKKSF